MMRRAAILGLVGLLSGPAFAGEAPEDYRFRYPSACLEDNEEFPVSVTVTRGDEVIIDGRVLSNTCLDIDGDGTVDRRVQVPNRTYSAELVDLEDDGTIDLRTYRTIMTDTSRGQNSRVNHALVISQDLEADGDFDTERKFVTSYFWEGPACRVSEEVRFSWSSDHGCDCSQRSVKIDCEGDQPLVYQVDRDCDGVYEGLGSCILDRPVGFFKVWDLL